MDSDDDILARGSASIKALKQFAHGVVTVDDLVAIERELNTAGSRTTAVVWASVVQEQVRRTIIHGMRSDLSNTIRGAIIDHDRPLGTFSAQNLAGYAFNMFGRKTFHDLEIIRELRNVFAHSRKALKFSTKEVSRVCATLQIPDLLVARVPPSLLIRANKAKKKIDRRVAKTRYVIACHTIALNLIEIYERPLPAEINRERFPKLLP